MVVWRELQVQRSYTLETSYCGCDQGPYQVPAEGREILRLRLTQRTWGRGADSAREEQSELNYVRFGCLPG